MLEVGISFAPLKLCDSDAYGDQKKTKIKMSKKLKFGISNIISCLCHKPLLLTLVFRLLQQCIPTK